MRSEDLAARGVAELKWEKEGVEDWKAVTPAGTYYCIRTFNDTSALWFNDQKLGNYGGGSHAEAKKAAQAHFNTIATPAALAAGDEVAALIRDAEARGMERAAQEVEEWAAQSYDAFRIHQSASAIRAEAAALRGEKEPK